MAEIRPFRGLRFAEQVVGDLSQVVAPPYDVISEEQQEILYRRSNYNFVRVDLARSPASGDRYAAAGETFREWCRSGVLVRDEVPCIYYLEEDYRNELGEEKTRRGFVSRVRIEAAESGLYRPHERTLAKPKEDRLRLTRACGANLSPVFSLYDDPSDRAVSCLSTAAQGREPDARASAEDGVETRLWKVSDPSVTAEVSAGVAGRSFFIADGHHRYETAQNYREERRREVQGTTGEEPWNYVMMYLANMRGEGLSVLPTHRLVYGLENFTGQDFLERASGDFQIERAGTDVGVLMRRMRQFLGKGHAFGVAIEGFEQLLLLTVRDLVGFRARIAEKVPAVLQELDVTILHSGLLEGVLGIDERAQEEQRNLRYVKSADELVASVVQERRGQLGFLMNPTRVDDVKAVAEAGLRMPQKSTFFYPKLLSGLVVNPMAE